MSENTQFFYLRRLKNSGYHRVGAMAIRHKEDGNGFIVAASLCSDNDKFNSSYAYNLAIERLNSPKHRTIVNHNGVSNNFMFSSVLCECGIHAKSSNFHGVVSNTKNYETFNKALETLDRITDN